MHRANKIGKTKTSEAEKGLIFILERETAAVLEQNIFPQMEVFAVPVFFLVFLLFAWRSPLLCFSASR